MGMTNVWYVEKTGESETFPSCPWAVDLRGVEFPGRSDVKDVYANVREKSLGVLVLGERKSRRLLGDVILTKAEVIAQRAYEDGCVPSTWNFDVHYPDRRFYAVFHEGDGFLTKDYRDLYVTPYFIPFRCLYSRNVPNLFMAGRNISVTHDALGAARVMRTCGMMGEIVGYAAALCLEYGIAPRQVYELQLARFLGRLHDLENKETHKSDVEKQMHSAL
ncbi:MAG TPA: hypothetical protein DCG32_05655 [Sphaerochaeta sp.]|jgi:hypothetical protein|nr:hypothetical protein [Sphaerochaeta sp.]